MGEPPAAGEVFTYFKAMRNKHLIHDENPWAQCLAAVVLNRETTKEAIADVTYLAFRVVTLDQPNYSNLKLLATKARQWVTVELDRLHKAIVADVSREDANELRAKPELRVRIPDGKEIGQRKGPPGTSAKHGSQDPR